MLSSSSYWAPLFGGLLFCISLTCVLSEAGQIETVHEKLEKYATGDAKESGLTPDELQAAFEEYKTWDPTKREDYESQQVTHALLVDFLLHPLEQAGERRRAKNDIALPIDDRYLKRLEKSYKMFRVAYQGQMIGNLYHKCDKTELLIRSLMGLKGKQELTVKMIYDAIVEYNAIMQRLSDIMIYEDVYTSLDELKQLLNFNNRTTVKVLNQVVYPQLSKLKSKKALDQIRNKYREKLADHRIIEVNGALKRVSRADISRWRQKKSTKS